MGRNLFFNALRTYLEVYFRCVFCSVGKEENMNFTAKKITTIGMLCAMAMGVNLLISFPMIPSVAFLKYDPKDIIIVMGGFIFGPMTALIMSTICAVLEILFRGGTILDILMNIISTSSFACTAAFLYKKNHFRRGAVIGLVFGALLSTASMLLWNYIITPIYFSMPREEVVKLLLPGILPFNLLKTGLNASITFVFYKGVVKALRKANLVKCNDHETKLSAGLIIFAVFICVSIVCIILAMQKII